jgi:hypothetical protein
MAKLDRLTGQLSHLPDIVARLALSIANAKKELDLSYVQNIKTIMGTIKETVGQDTAPQDILPLLKALMPGRFHFTEATIDFSADLAETMDMSLSAGGEVGTPVAAVNAALSLGYGYDYRAAAHISVKMHEIPPDLELTAQLLGRAKEIDTGKLKIPDRSQVEKELHESTKDVFTALTKAGGGQ